LLGRPSAHHRHEGPGRGDDGDDYGDDYGDDSESSWTDTGDIAEQLAAEDPLRQHLSKNESLDDEILAGVLKRHPRHHHHLPPRNNTRQGKRVHYHNPRSSHDADTDDDDDYRPGVIDKEAIYIPDHAQHSPSAAERLLAGIMSGGGGSIHGLTGKPLLFVPHDSSHHKAPPANMLQLFHLHLRIIGGVPLRI
jgi:hypothetical protein